MSIHFSGSVSCVIPLAYQCSNCGKKAVATIPLSEDYRGSYGTLTGYRKQQEIQETARREAIGRLREMIIEIYAQEPLACKESLVGTCTACGHKEIWQISLKEHKQQTTSATIIGFIILIASILIPFLLESLMLIPVFMLGSLALVIAIGILSSKFPSKKAKEKQAAIAKIPKENRPVFILSRKEMLDKFFNDLQQNQNS